MSLPTFVKISNVSNLSDARYCAGMMVDVIGFDLNPHSSTRIHKEDYDEITEWIAGVKFAGEFGTATADEIKQTIQGYSIDLIETSNWEEIERIHELGKVLIFKLIITKESEIAKLRTTLAYLDERVSYVLIQSDNASIYDRLDSEISDCSSQALLIKGYGVEPQKGIEKYPGLALEATAEERPGYKDYGHVMDVLELLDED